MSDINHRVARCTQIDAPISKVIRLSGWIALYSRRRIPSRVSRLVLADATGLDVPEAMPGLLHIRMHGRWEKTLPHWNGGILG